MTKNKRRGQQKKGQKPGAYSPQQKGKIPAIVPPVMTTGGSPTKREIEGQGQQPAPESQWRGWIGAWFRRGSLVVRAAKYICTLILAAVPVMSLYLVYQGFVVSNRATVSIDTLEVNLPILNFTLKKTGKLPATNVVVFVKERRFPMKTTLALAESLLEKGDRIEGKGGEEVLKTGDNLTVPGESVYKFGVTVHNLGPEEVERLRTGEDVLVVMGTISYDDGTWFKSRQTAPYCLVHNPNLSGSQWYTCPTTKVEKDGGGDMVYQGKGEEER